MIRKADISAIRGPAGTRETDQLATGITRKNLEKFFDNPEHLREFEEWLQKREGQERGQSK